MEIVLMLLRQIRARCFDKFQNFSTLKSQVTVVDQTESDNMFPLAVIRTKLDVIYRPR